MATVKAFIRTTHKDNATCNVRFRLTDGRGVQFFGTSNLKVRLNDWDSKNEKIKAKVVYNSINRKDFDNSILEHKQYILTNYAKAGVNLSTDWLEKLLDKKYYPEKYIDKTVDTFFSLFNDFIEKHEMSSLREKHFYVVYRNLKRFEKFSNKTLSVDTFDINTLIEYKRFLEIEHTYLEDRPDLYAGLNKKELPKKRSENTIIGILKKLRTFYNWLCRVWKSQNDPFKNFEIGSSIYGTPIFITKEERDKIANFNLKSRPKLAIQRDIFIFQCLVGCRVGDLINFKKSNIHNNVLSYIPNKTAKNEPKTVEVPLSDNGMKLLSRYKDNEGDSLLPFISNQKYNNAIKDIFTLAGITRLVTWFNPQTKQGEQRPINEIASSHLARRTFIGNLSLSTDLNY